jgi:hypothetical protein
MEPLRITRFKIETHSRNDGSDDPYQMNHLVTIKAAIGDRRFHAVDDDSADNKGPIGTIEKVLKKILLQAGIDEKKIPELVSFSVPMTDTHLVSAAAEIEVTTIFQTEMHEAKLKLKGKDIIAIALTIFVTAYNALID